MRIFGAIRKRLTFVKFERFASVRNMPRPPCWSPEMVQVQLLHLIKVVSSINLQPTHKNALAIWCEVNCIERNFCIRKFNALARWNVHRVDDCASKNDKIAIEWVKGGQVEESQPELDDGSHDKLVCWLTSNCSFCSSQTVATARHSQHAKRSIFQKVQFARRWLVQDFIIENFYQIYGLF